MALEFTQPNDRAELRATREEERERRTLAGCALRPYLAAVASAIWRAIDLLGLDVCRKV